MSYQLSVVGYQLKAVRNNLYPLRIFKGIASCFQKPLVTEN